VSSGGVSLLEAEAGLVPARGGAKADSEIKPDIEGTRQSGGRNSHELLCRAREGDTSAQEKCVEENSGLIWSVSRRFFGRGVEPDDLYQLGCVGFLKALRDFDPEYGTQFSTYAVPKIAGEIRRFLRDDGAVKVSRGIKEQASRIRVTRHILEQRLGREPSLNEIADETGIEAAEIAATETAVAIPESISENSGEEGSCLEHILTDYAGEDRLIEQVALREAVSLLPEKEKLVIALRFYRGLTQDEVSKILKVSQVQISRIERRALSRLKDQLS